MKRVTTILGFIAAIISVILAVTPLSKLAFIPGVFALILGIIAIYTSKQDDSKKSIQLIFLLTIIALVLTTYKSIFNTVEVGNTEELQEKINESQEEAIDELEDIELDEADLE